MTWEVFGHNIFLIVAVSFLVSAFLVPVAKKIAFHIGAVDKPNKRRVNKVEMPTQGGLAIFASFLLCFMLFVDMNTQMFSILIGSFLIILTGMIDGINPIKARHKMLAQIIAASIVVFYGGIYLTEITLPGIYLLLPTLANQIISVVFIVGIINAINLIDGLDGLCAGVSSIYFLTIAIIAFTLNMLGGLDIILSLIMFGATLGFLFHNFPPAKIYLGDTGSMFLGYIISVIALVLITVGYMNFTSNTLNTTETTGMLLDSEQMAGIGDAKLVNSNNVVNNNEEVSSSISDSAPENEVNTQNTTTNVVEDVSAKNYSSEYFVASKLERDKMYSQMLETYQRLLENSTITPEQKAIFTQELTKINNEKTSIMISENLITNMGYENVVIFINDNSVSVIIKAEKLEEADIAKIQNIVCREIGVSTEMVHISLK